MKVIGAGYGRTGTMSLKAALEEIGQGPTFHMIDLIREPERLPDWQAAANGEAVDWTQVLAGYESTVDWPGCTFWRDMVDTWPDAPVLLNVRDPEAWHRSCLDSIHAAKDAGLAGQLGGGNETPPSVEVMEFINGMIWQGTFGGRFEDKDHAISVFHQHVADVKAAVPADRLLVYEISEGWEPLCSFLGVDVPDHPMPHLNDTASFRAMFGMPSLAPAPGG